MRSKCCMQKWNILLQRSTKTSAPQPISLPEPPTKAGTHVRVLATFAFVSGAKNVALLKATSNLGYLFAQIFLYNRSSLFMQGTVQKIRISLGPKSPFLLHALRYCTGKCSLSLIYNSRLNVLGRNSTNKPKYSLFVSNGNVLPLSKK